MPLRMSLTISGAVALGAYEGGALAALLVGARELAAGPDPQLAVDVMSGASAGSITALLAARSLLEGHDPVAVMHTAWVQKDSIGDLLAFNTQAPLSIDRLRDMAAGLIDPKDRPSGRRQAQPVRLSYTLACLRGLDYWLPRAGRGEPVDASTYVDFYDHTLAPGTATAALTEPAGASPLDAVLASAANAMGFPPRLVDRSAVWDRYAQQGIHDLPEHSRSLWYTDGGTLDNEPLGRTLDLTGEADADAPDDSRRLHLLIHPHPTGAPKGDEWAQPDVQPTFVQTAVRALELQRTQSLYTDLKRVEKTNSRLQWLRALAGELAGTLDALTPADRDTVLGALDRAVTTVLADKAALRGQGGREPVAPAPLPPARERLGDTLFDRLCTIAGLGGKNEAVVDVISPRLLPEAAEYPVERLLSGEVLFHFGGFLDEHARQADFDLGYRSTLAWWQQGELAQREPDLAARAHDAAVAAHTPGDGWKEYGDKTVGSLLAMHPVQAAGLTAQISHVVLHDLLVHRKP